MINYIVLKLNPKCSTLIHKNSFIDIINSLETTIENIKIKKEKTEVIILKGGRNFRIKISIMVKNGEILSKKIKEIKQKIDAHSLYLIDQKPNNIIINTISSY